MNEYDNITVSGTVSGAIIMPEITKAIAKMEQDMRTVQDEIRRLRGHLIKAAEEREQLRSYIEYLNPEDGKRPANPLSYADWIKLGKVSEKIEQAA
jgi:hypothetical protein